MADRLVAGAPPDRAHSALAALLRATKAPGSAAELAGQRAAVAGFVAAYRGYLPTRTPGDRSRVPVPLSARAVAVKVAVAVAVLAAGGTVLAAETGHLPVGMQQRAHHLFGSLGVPAPGTDRQPTGTGSDASPAASSAAPAAGASDGTSAPSSPAVLALCQAWDAAQKDPQGKAMTADALGSLAAAAGSAADIPGFCATLLSGHPTGATRSAPARPATTMATPTHPSGDGNGTGRARPTPTPHR